MFDAVHLQNFYEGFFGRHLHGRVLIVQRYAAEYRDGLRWREIATALGFDATEISF
jgi:hypothetical protein